MSADFTIGQGDTSPILTDTLSYSNGVPANLAGATVQLVIRNPTAPQPVRLTGTVTITNATEGRVSYTFTAQDTALVGLYMASWEVTLGGGAKMRWPTDGWITISIEPSLTTPGTGTIIGLPEVLDRLQVPPNDRIHDAKLQEWIEAVAPLIEDLTGPIVPQVYDEWYEGGHTTISLRHRPSAGMGTTPILNVLAVVEYRGPIPYDLLNVPAPNQGSVYSIMVNKQLGYIARRTSGGGEEPFYSSSGHAAQNINVRYEAGQEQVPQNVKMATIETIKWWWESTQPIGEALLSGSSGRPPEESGKPLVALPYHVEAMLAPTRRAPSIA
jgi:BppU N-terminal domain